MIRWHLGMARYRIGQGLDLIAASWACEGWRRILRIR